MMGSQTQSVAGNRGRSSARPCQARPMTDLQELLEAARMIVMSQPRTYTGDPDRMTEEQIKETMRHQDEQAILDEFRRLVLKSSNPLDLGSLLREMVTQLEKTGYDDDLIANRWLSLILAALRAEVLKR